MNFRDLPNPSAADIEAFVNQQLSKATLAQGLRSETVPILAQDWDFRVDKANEFPGRGWEYHAVAVLGVNVYIVWRKSRVEQAKAGEVSIMALTGAVAKPPGS